MDVGGWDGLLWFCGTDTSSGTTSVGAGRDVTGTGRDSVALSLGSVALKLFSTFGTREKNPIT